ncbi:MAG: enoyl-CoA hydratase [Rhizobiales bacterium]|nr:enoyl-CoA hydratase [Hyphomicrobiales bacterium]
MTLLLESDDKTLRVERQGHVAHLVFDNPAKHNAVTLDGWTNLGEAARVLHGDERIRVIVVSGAGSAAFVSGSDISEFDARRSEMAAIQHYNHIADGSLAALASIDKPMIASVRGYCLGGGMAIMLCCDIRLAAEDAVFAVPAARIGLAYRYPGIAQFLQAVGPARTSEIFMTARRYDAREAHAMGLVNRVVARDELSDVTAQYCEQIAENAPLTIRALKATIRELTKPTGNPDTVLMERMADACFASEDYKEGRAAFAAKRRPKFEGK